MFSSSWSTFLSYWLKAMKLPPRLKGILKQSPLAPVYYHFKRYSLRYEFAKVCFWLASTREPVTVSLRKYGRFSPYLFLALSRAGCRLEIDDRFFYFAEVGALLRKNRIPILSTKNIYENASKKILLYDHDSMNQSTGWRKEVRLNYDYYSARSKENAIVMPYFLHPHAYISGVFAKLPKLRKKQRHIRFFFAGTYNEEAYTKDFHFPMLNRFQIIRQIMSDFSDEILLLNEKGLISEFLRSENRKPIVMALSEDRANTLNKFLLPYEDYIQLLSESFFFLAAPGVSIPHSHNAIEAIALGTIPVLNYANYGWTPALEHGKNCIAFSNQDELRARVNEVLSFPERDILEMQANVQDYYETYLKPESFASRLLAHPEPSLTLYVNAEDETARLYARHQHH